MLEDNNWIAGAVEALASGATVAADTRIGVPRRKTGRATVAAMPRERTPSHPDSSLPLESRNPRRARSEEPHFAAPEQGQKPVTECAADTELSGHALSENQRKFAAQPHSIEGPLTSATHCSTAFDGTIIADIVEQWRRRQDMLRAHTRLNLQAQASCRRVCDGDKAKGAKLWKDVLADPAHELRPWLNPFIVAMEPLKQGQREFERTLTKLVKQLPIYVWSSTVSGLGEVSLAGIIGECGIGPGEYRSVSALWKRMGMAVIHGERQRRIGGDEALIHGYNAQRRSHMWIVGASLMQQQLRSEKGEDGKKIEGTDYAIGEYGQVYLDRKAYLRERDPDRSAGHIHNDAKRYMEKRLLRHLWQEWRRAIETLPSDEVTPAADIRDAA